MLVYGLTLHLWVISAITKVMQFTNLNIAVSILTRDYMYL